MVLWEKFSIVFSSEKASLSLKLETKLAPPVVVWHSLRLAILLVLIWSTGVKIWLISMICCGTWPSKPAYQLTSQSGCRQIFLFLSFSVEEASQNTRERRGRVKQSNTDLFTMHNIWVLLSFSDHRHSILSAIIFLSAFLLLPLAIITKHGFWEIGFMDSFPPPCASLSICTDILRAAQRVVCFEPPFSQSYLKR